MIEQNVSVTLAQSPEVAFDFFADFPNEPAWNPECLSVEKTSSGPAGVGATYVGRMRGVGRIDSEIVGYDRARSLATVERSRVATGQFEFRFTPDGTGSRVDVVMRMQPRGLIRLLTPVMRAMSRKLLAELPTHMRNGIDAAHPVA